MHHTRVRFKQGDQGTTTRYPEPIDRLLLSEETYHDIRHDQEGDFAYGPGESPDYVEYIPEALALLDLLMETAPGSADALRLAQLVRKKMWKEL